MAEDIFSDSEAGLYVTDVIRRITDRYDRVLSQAPFHGASLNSPTIDDRAGRRA
jgi:hypothetical protein